jgi:hypothetical protein
MKSIKWVEPEYLKWHHIPAKMWREEDMYVCVVPDLNAYTQGYTKNHTYKMVVDMLKGLAFCYINPTMGWTQNEINSWRPKIVQFKNGNLIIGSNDLYLMMILVDQHKKACRLCKEAADEFLLKNPPIE